jgi:hypothetical protein
VVRWDVVEPTAALYSWTVVRHQVHPAFPAPYTIVLVELTGLHDDAPPVRLVGHLDGEPELAAGMALEVRFDRRTGATLPVWEPATRR